jgi:drug/metabolite transporter (DMT)-like permease
LNVGLFLATAVMWAAGWVATRLQVDVAPASPAVAWRVIAAAVILQVALRATGRHPGTRARDLPFVALQGLALFSANNLVLYEAVRHVASGLVALVMASVIPLNAVGLRLFYGVAFRRGVLVGAPIAAFGLALVFLPEWETLGRAGAWLGVVLGAVGSVIVAAGNMVAVRNARAGLPTFPLIADGLVFAIPLAVGACFVQGVGMPFPRDPGWIGALAYQVLGLSIVSFWCYFTLQARIGPDRAAFVLVLVPVIALGISSVVEGYVWTLPAVAGVALVAVGNVLALGWRR